jgi:hypothetical protein
LGKDERGIVLSSGQKDRTLQNGRAEIPGLAVFHGLCEKISVNSKTVIKVIYWSD